MHFGNGANSMENIIKMFGEYLPYVGIFLIIVLVFSGRTFRENWKAQGPGWKVKCWISGVIALISFSVLAFVPLVQG